MRTSILVLACAVIGFLPPAAWFTFRYQQVKVSSCCCISFHKLNRSTETVPCFRKSKFLKWPIFVLNKQKKNTNFLVIWSCKNMYETEKFNLRCKYTKQISITMRTFRLLCIAEGKLNIEMRCLTHINAEILSKWKHTKSIAKMKVTEIHRKRKFLLAASKWMCQILSKFSVSGHFHLSPLVHLISIYFLFSLETPLLRTHVFEYESLKVPKPTNMSKKIQPIDLFMSLTRQKYT